MPKLTALPARLPGNLKQRATAAIDHHELNLATQHPEDPERLIVVRLGRISEQHAAQAAWDFLDSWQLFPVYLERSAGIGQGTIRLYPILYQSLGTTLFASIEAPSLETAHDWLGMVTVSCVMFNP